MKMGKIARQKTQMVKSVNAGWVEKMDWLSDEVYYYRRGSGEAVIAD